MKRHTVRVPVFAVLACLTAGRSALAQDAKPTIAIADVALTPGGSTLPPPQLGAAIVQLLLDELVSSRRFHVYDGQWLVPESEAGGRVNLDRLRAGAAASQVDYLILGSVTAFSTEQQVRRGGGLLPLPFVGGGFSRQQTLTAVGVTFRVVDVRTGEVVTTTTSQGYGKRKATALGLLGVLHGLPLGGGGGARSSMSRDAMLDEAVREAVHGAAGALMASAFRLARGAASSDTNRQSGIDNPCNRQSPICSRQ
ncbi:MAG TPA: CsgG/HfaB family protein [Vicinamibacterales bacterium]